ncbi:MAG: purine-nucleoside phosphorylase [Sphaerochaeta sp.]|nr:purine-nucleoside phosphorylase [Sphaerochaeta sp.]
MIEGYTYEFYRTAAEYIRERIGFSPEIAIILGTGCAPFAEKVENPVEFPYSEIPNFLITTNQSHAGKMIAGSIAGKKVICMNGRFHYYEGYSMEELNIPVHVMHVLGVKTLILTNAAGAVNPEYKPGDAMIIKDHIKLHLGSPLRGQNVPELGPRFFGVADLYTKKLRAIAKECARKSAMAIHEGVYMFFPGPQFETAAEIRAAGLLGADAVGMSTVTEALTAAHCSMNLLGVALITNMATGVLDELEDGSGVDGVAQKASVDFSSFLKDVVQSI